MHSYMIKTLTFVFKEHFFNFTFTSQSIFSLSPAHCINLCTFSLIILSFLNRNLEQDQIFRVFLKSPLAIVQLKKRQELLLPQPKIPLISYDKLQLLRSNYCYHLQKYQSFSFSSLFQVKVKPQIDSKTDLNCTGQYPYSIYE